MLLPMGPWVERIVDVWRFGVWGGLHAVTLQKGSFRATLQKRDVGSANLVCDHRVIGSPAASHC